MINLSFCPLVPVNQNLRADIQGGLASLAQATSILALRGTVVRKLRLGQGYPVDPSMENFAVTDSDKLAWCCAAEGDCVVGSQVYALGLHQWPRRDQENPD